MDDSRMLGFLTQRKKFPHIGDSFLFQFAPLAIEFVFSLA